MNELVETLRGQKKLHRKYVMEVCPAPSRPPRMHRIIPHPPFQRLPRSPIPPDLASQPRLLPQPAERGRHYRARGLRGARPVLASARPLCRSHAPPPSTLPPAPCSSPCAAMCTGSFTTCSTFSRSTAFPRRCGNVQTRDGVCRAHVWPSCTVTAHTPTTPPRTTHTSSTAILLTAAAFPWRSSLPSSATSCCTPTTFTCVSVACRTASSAAALRFFPASTPSHPISAHPISPNHLLADVTRQPRDDQHEPDVRL